LQNLTRATVWLERGVTRRLDKGFGHFEAWRDEVFAAEEAERHKQDRRILREIQWMHYGGVTARRARNEGRRRKMEAMRLEQRNRTVRVGTVRMAASEADASGKLVAEAKGISKAYGDLVVINDLSIRVSRGDRLGIVGPNGAGKTTLIDLLTGTQAPDSGTIRLGASVAMVTLDQKRESLDPEMTLSEALTGGKGDHVEVAGQKKHVVSYMQDFLFASEQARTPLRVLSGGERGRLMLARALAKPSNLLVLDEPTNDLDLETLDLLEDLLAEYAGTVLLVSHDRDFLDRVVTSVLMSEGEGRWTEYAGGYSDMVAQRGQGVQRREARAVAAKLAGGGAAASAATSPEAPARKKKLGFKEQHALTTLPATMAALEADIARQEAVLTDATLYTRDPALFARTSAAIGKAREQLSAAEEEWLRLELLREELESGTA
jgi:ABC transport system ATP-binding/permease protein